jgi:predicted dehydrogenase
LTLIRTALVGYGYAGRHLHTPLIIGTPGLALTDIVSRQPAQVAADLGAAVQVWPDLASLLAARRVELVVLASPNALHAPQAVAALQAGCHVVVDKPMALDHGEAQSMCVAADAAGRHLSVFHNRRWDSDFLLLQQLLGQGTAAEADAAAAGLPRLGRLSHFEAHFDRYRPQVRDRWREGEGPGAGIWMDLGPHLLDQALQLFGWPMAIQLDLRRERAGALADDAFDAVLRWAPAGASGDPDPQACLGLRARLSASMLTARPGPRFLLHGEAGSLRIEGLDGQETALKNGWSRLSLPWPYKVDGKSAPGIGEKPLRLEEAAASVFRARPEPLGRAHYWPGNAAGLDTQVDPPGQPVALPAGDYPAYYAALRDAILGCGPCPAPGRQASQVQRLLDAGQLSAHERREVLLDR